MVRPSQSVAVFLAALLLTLSGCWTESPESPPEVSAAPVPVKATEVPVKATEVVVEDFVPVQQFVGTILPLKRVVVGSAVDGRVSKVFVEAGDRVDGIIDIEESDAKPSENSEAGEGGEPATNEEEAAEPEGAEDKPFPENVKLVQLLTDTITSELNAAVAELELRQEERRELETGSRPEEKEQAKAKFLATKALKEFAQARLRRNESLFRQSRGISSDELEESIALAEQATQNHIEADATYKLVEEGPREEKKTQARARVKGQQALVQQMRDRLKKHTIISRFPGYVIAEHAEEGQWLSQGDPVAEIVALDFVEIEAHVAEQHVQYVSVGRQVEVYVRSVSNENFDGKFTGRISAIIPQADSQTRTFPVRVIVENTLIDNVPLLRSGMLAQVTLPVGALQRNAVLVPKDALVLRGDERRVADVFILSGGGKGKANRIQVELGDGVGDLVRVRTGLEKGQFVVVEGNERLRPGQDVEARVVEAPEIPKQNIPAKQK